MKKDVVDAFTLLSTSVDDYIIRPYKYWNGEKPDTEPSISHNLRFKKFLLAYCLHQEQTLASCMIRTFERIEIKVLIRRYAPKLINFPMIQLYLDH